MKKVHIIMRGCDEQKWLDHNVKTSDDVSIFYCGYLEFDDSVDIKEEDIWDWCNWACWSIEKKPRECENLLIGHCNSDMSYYYDGTWYCHKDMPFSSFDECYRVMKEIKCSIYNFRFNALWPAMVPNSLIVTPENIGSIIK